MQKITILSFFILTMALQAQDRIYSSINGYNNGGSWEYNSGSNYEYDGNGNLISQTELVWNSVSSTWENNYKYNYTYNGNNKVTLEVYQQWNSTTNQFEDYYRSTHSYNGAGLNTLIIDETKEGASWNFDYKIEFTYAGGKVDESISYTHNGTDWDIDSRSEIAYGTNGRVDVINIYYPNGANWDLTYRDLYTYDANDMVSNQTYQEWNTNTNTWDESEKTEYIVAANGNRTKETSTYDGDTYVKDFTFDSGALMSSFMHPFKDKTGLEYITEDFPYYNKVLEEVENGIYKTTYNYSNPIVLSVKEAKIVENKITVFPNPTRGDINIESLSNKISNVAIYNAIGSKVYSTNDTNFSIDFLKTGVYFLHLTTSNGVKTTKQIIKK